MKKLIYVTLIVAAVSLVSCGRNYYSGNGKGSKCGCPSTRGY